MSKDFLSMAALAEHYQREPADCWKAVSAGILPEPEGRGTVFGWPLVTLQERETSLRRFWGVESAEDAHLDAIADAIAERIAARQAGTVAPAAVVTDPFANMPKAKPTLTPEQQAELDETIEAYDRRYH